MRVKHKNWFKTNNYFIMTTTDISWLKQVTLIDKVLSLTLVHGGHSCRVKTYRLTSPHPLSPDMCHHHPSRHPPVYKVDYDPGL